MGSAGILLIFFGLLYRILFLAERQRSKFSRVYAYSVASILFFHITINIGMTIGLIPVIGIPLPFVSAGGSSLWGFTLLLFTFLRYDQVRRN
jgi:rod shape determining protein RodA